MSAAGLRPEWKKIMNVSRTSKFLRYNFKIKNLLENK